MGLNWVENGSSWQLTISTTSLINQILFYLTERKLALQHFGKRATAMQQLRPGSGWINWNIQEILFTTDYDTHYNNRQLRKHWFFSYEIDTKSLITLSVIVEFDNIAFFPVLFTEVSYHHAQNSNYVLNDVQSTTKCLSSLKLGLCNINCSWRV